MRMEGSKGYAEMALVRDVDYSFMMRMNGFERSFSVCRVSPN
jgi:hypothetical protein